MKNILILISFTFLPSVLLANDVAPRINRLYTPLAGTSIFIEGGDYRDKSENQEILEEVANPLSTIRSLHLRNVSFYNWPRLPVAIWANRRSSQSLKRLFLGVDGRRNARPEYMESIVKVLNASHGLEKLSLTLTGLTAEQTQFILSAPLGDRLDREIFLPDYYKGLPVGPSIRLELISEKPDYLHEVLPFLSQRNIHQVTIRHSRMSEKDFTALHEFLERGPKIKKFVLNAPLSYLALRVFLTVFSKTEVESFHFENVAGSRPLPRGYEMVFAGRVAQALKDAAYQRLRSLSLVGIPLFEKEYQPLFETIKELLVTRYAALDRLLPLQKVFLSPSLNWGRNEQLVELLEADANSRILNIGDLINSFYADNVPVELNGVIAAYSKLQARVAEEQKALRKAQRAVTITKAQTHDDMQTKDEPLAAFIMRNFIREEHNVICYTESLPELNRLRGTLLEALFHTS